MIKLSTLIVETGNCLVDCFELFQGKKRFFFFFFLSIYQSSLAGVTAPLWFHQHTCVTLHAKNFFFFFLHFRIRLLRFETSCFSSAAPDEKAERFILFCFFFYLRHNFNFTESLAATGGLKRAAKIKEEKLFFKKNLFYFTSLTGNLCFFFFKKRPRCRRRARRCQSGWKSSRRPVSDV